MNKNIKRYRWRCPVKGCNAMGKKFMPKYKTGKFGRNHLKRKHKIYDMEPILDEGRAEAEENLLVFKDKRYNDYEVYTNDGKFLGVCNNKKEIRELIEDYRKVKDRL